MDSIQQPSVNKYYVTCPVSGEKIFASADVCLKIVFSDLTKPQTESLKLLWASEFTCETPRTFYVRKDDPVLLRSLLMSDVFGWALGMAEVIPADQLDEVARLFKEYGFCGLVYWVSQRNGEMRSEFPAMNRKIDYVAHEEAARLAAKDTTDWAYKKVSYLVEG